MNNQSAKGQSDSRLGRLSCYLDGELSSQDSAAFEQELASDAALRAEFDSWKRIRSQLRGAVQAAPLPDGLEARVRSRTTHRPSWSLPLRARWQTATVLALFVLLVVSLWQFTRNPVGRLEDFSPAVAAILEIGVGKHVSCVKERLKPNADALGSYQTSVPAPYDEMLEAARRALPADFRVVEVHLCGTQGRQFAHLTLSRNNGYLSVLLTERRAGDPAPEDSRMAAATVGNVALYALEKDGLNVGVFTLPRQYAFVISEYGRRQNIQFTRNVASAIQ